MATEITEAEVHAALNEWAQMEVSVGLSVAFSPGMMIHIKGKLVASKGGWYQLKCSDAQDVVFCVPSYKVFYRLVHGPIQAFTLTSPKELMPPFSITLAVNTETEIDAMQAFSELVH